ncbi:uncharacterized protein METZ01_LOCUS77469 [marine metagenome]|uniref:Uncharacterized protein n=1 Tax=marine metagenome TaxID=408172 RepID=A0A381U8P4_9ZZZZ
MGERLNGIQEVVSSILISSTRQTQYPGICLIPSKYIFHSLEMQFNLKSDMEGVSVKRRCGTLPDIIKEF